VEGDKEMEREIIERVRKVRGNNPSDAQLRADYAYIRARARLEIENGHKGNK
jgi:hypothetical protein